MFGEQPRFQHLAGERIHLSCGPIDIVMRAWGEPSAVAYAYAAAWARFAAILGELVAELPALRRPMAEAPVVTGPVARRMSAACAPFAPAFITPMAAVAGAVADEVMAVMIRAAPLARAYVNNGGDIAVHLAEGESLRLGIAGDIGDPRAPLTGHIALRAGDGIGGIATSGWAGRSFSLGIADSVTVLARTAAGADAAATLIANAVAVDSPAVRRKPARALDPDSDLGDRLVTVDVGPLSAAEIAQALDWGRRCAEEYCRAGLIAAAALSLKGETLTVGDRFTAPLPAFEGAGS